MFDGKNHFWGYYCRDRGNGRHLVIQTNKQMYVGAEQRKETLEFLKEKFVEFMQKHETDYELSDDFGFEPVNIYKPLV